MNYNDNPPIIRWKRGAVDEDARLTVSTKTSRWSYEREWRLINPAVGKSTYNSDSCVARVYLGSRIDEKERRLLIRHLRALDIPIHQMTLEKYNMRFEAVSNPSESAGKPSKVTSNARPIKNAKSLRRTKTPAKRRTIAKRRA
jgi:hypothetical protein